MARLFNPRKGQRLIDKKLGICVGVEANEHQAPHQQCGCSHISGSSKQVLGKNVIFRTIVGNVKAIQASSFGHNESVDVLKQGQRFITFANVLSTRLH